MTVNPSAKRRKDPRQIYTSSVTSRHPLGIKPRGNALLESPARQYKLRRDSLGHLAVLRDEDVMTLLSYIDDLETLKALMQVSKYLFAFLSDEEFWRKLYMNQLSTGIDWKGTWKKTILKWKNDIGLKVDLNSEILYRPYQIANIDYAKLFSRLIEDEAKMKQMKINPDDRIPRFSEMGKEQFSQIKSPFILTGYKWPKWTLEELESRFGDVEFQQESANWKLSHFIKYLKSNQDESPLYLFDHKSKAMNDLKSEYKQCIPEIFKQDYFHVLGKSRPDHAWVIIGSERSGSTFHKDPNNTSAWNACITGKKLWVMLPPHITPPGVTVSDDQSEITSPIGIGEWVLSGFYLDVLKIPEALIGITFPGECMYVPSNWWHLVINIEDSIALTENFVPEKDLANVLNFFQTRSRQISGFKLNDIKDLIESLTTKTDKIDQFLDILSNDKSIDLFEDCGELDNLPDTPIFEIFKQLLKDGSYQEQLAAALEEIKPKPKKKTWSIVKDAPEATAVFSFNFAVD